MEYHPAFSANKPSGYQAGITAVKNNSLYQTNNCPVLNHPAPAAVHYTAPAYPKKLPSKMLPPICPGPVSGIVRNHFTIGL